MGQSAKNLINTRSVTLTQCCKNPKECHFCMNWRCFPPKPKLLIGIPARLANKRPGFFGGKFQFKFLKHCVYDEALSFKKNLCSPLFSKDSLGCTSPFLLFIIIGTFTTISSCSTTSNAGGGRCRVHWKITTFRETVLLILMCRRLWCHTIGDTAAAAGFLLKAKLKYF